MSLHREYVDLGSARNHAAIHGYPRPKANTHDLIASTAFVTTAAVVLDALREAAN